MLNHFTLEVLKLVFAGVLLKVSPAKAKDVHKKLQKVSGVKQVMAVFGRFDMVVMLEAKDVGALGKIVTEEIGSIPGVNSTETLIEAKL